MIKNFSKNCLLLFSISYFLSPLAALGAAPAVYFDVPESIAVGAEFTARVLVDSDVKLNAYEITFSYPREIAEVARFNNGHSIIDVWQTKPTYEDGLITFSGGSLSPFSGKQGELLSVRFKALGEGSAEFRLRDAVAYVADGHGTKITPVIQDATVVVLPHDFVPIEAVPVAESRESDTTPPQIEFLSFVADPFSQNQKILSFRVSDPDSGIKETIARARGWFSWNTWQTVQNSVALPNNVWAVDFMTTNNAGGAARKIIYDWAAFVRGPLILLALFCTGTVLLINMARKRVKRYDK